MEEHRLTTMESFDEGVFNRIYKNVEGLKRKLAGDINPEKFGVTYQDILSWFDVKILFVFNKYYQKTDEETLKGYIINAIKNYKYRILKVSYQEKYSVEKEEVENLEDYEKLKVENGEENCDWEFLVEEAFNYFKNTLSYETYQILCCEINPPLFIIREMEDEGKNSLTKIPSKFIAEYLGYDRSSKSINYVNKLRRDIKEQIEEAQEYFNS